MLEIQSNIVNFERKFTPLQPAESSCPVYDYKILEVKADWLKRLSDFGSSGFGFLATQSSKSPGYEVVSICTFSQNVLSHAATLNIYQSLQVLQACDYSIWQVATVLYCIKL